MTLQPPIPVLRIFDITLAKRFYVEWLAFSIDWEVEAGPGGPKYVQVSRGPVALHLTEHYGDCSPWAKVFINMRPGVDVAPWNAKVMEVIDPFGNRLCFNQPLAASRI